MFSHVMVGVKDLNASKKFYDAVLGTLGIAPGVANNNRYFRNIFMHELGHGFVSQKTQVPVPGALASFQGSRKLTWHDVCSILTIDLARVEPHIDLGGRSAAGKGPREAPDSPFHIPANCDGFPPNFSGV
jgi:catechol 2,3-dioxygenase-like lactoylglutathione lyase family enzyme